MIRELLEGSVTRLLRIGSYAALLGLAIMCSSLIWPRALPVIFAMSVGHVVGGAALLCYLLAVRIDARRAHLRKLASGERDSLPAPDKPST